MGRFEEAINFAAEAHSGQVRKFRGTPYILHPFEVSGIIATITGNEDVLIAGLLHDTIEDCDVDPQVIKDKFGARVSALVQSESEDKLSTESAEKTWMERKESSLLMLQNTKDIDVKIMWLADKLSNIRSFYREHREIGDQFFFRLHQKDKKKQEWYYRTVAECVKELKSTAAYDEYVELVDKVFSEEEDK